MNIWSAEIKELEHLLQSVSGRLHELEKELIQVIKAEDSNVVLLYSRRCLEVIVTDLCESELNRPRKTEPLKGIIDRLNKEEKVPSNIVTSMQNLNSLSVYGTHPKDFDPRQVKPVLNNLSTIIDWFLKHNGIEVEIAAGIQEVVEAIESEEHPSYEKVDNSRKRSISLIAGISIIIVVLLFVFDVFSLFRKDRFKEIRDPDGKISIAVMPFENLTGDSTLNFWQNGISEFLINDLGNSEELAVLSSRVISEVMETQEQLKTLSVSPAVARDVARKIRAGTHITGSFMGSGEEVSIMVNLVNTENGELIWSNRVNGALVSGKYRYLLDSLSAMVGNFLEIQAMEQQANEDFINAFPNSAEAYKYYIDGLNSIVAYDIESAIASLTKAFEIDSNFTFAAFYMAWAYNLSTGLSKEYYEWTKKAHELKHNIPVKYHSWIDLWYACSNTKDGDDILKYCDLLAKSDVKSRLFWYDIGITYASLDEYEKAVLAFEKVEELNREWGENWKFVQYYIQYGEALSMAGRPEEVDEVVQLGLQVDPEHRSLKRIQGLANIKLGDTAAAEKNFSEYKSLSTASESTKEFWIGRMYLDGSDTLMAIEHFRSGYDLDKDNLEILVYLSYVLLQTGIDVEEGLVLAEEGLKLFPEHMYTNWAYGFALHKSGNHEEALIYLKFVDENVFGYLRQLKEDIQEVEQALARAEASEAEIE